MSQTRRRMPEDWASSPRTKIYTRPAWEPRDERVKIPKSAQRARPSPIHLLSPPETPSPESPSVPSQRRVAPYETPRDPEIVDLALPNSWPRRGAPPPRLGPPSRRMPSPSIYSGCSTARQSEQSFGILDYYTRDPSPLHSPVLPPPTPKVDPAMDKFDFQLAPSTPKQAGLKALSVSVKLTPEANSEPEVRAGAESEDGLMDLTPPTKPPHKRAYSLFPTIKETRIPSSEIAGATTQPHTPSPLNNASSLPSHQQPDASYRPRKESLSSSIRSRKDSFTSFRSNRHIPLRILSSSTTASGGQMSSSMSASPPEHRSRWSEDTITSPTAATTSGPRTSFGSLLAGRDSTQYPACFFEDDDEEAPLRKKFAWTRSTSLTHERQGGQHKGGRFDERQGFVYHVRRILLCGGCGSARRRTTR